MKKILEFIPTHILLYYILGILLQGAFFLFTEFLLTGILFSSFLAGYFLFKKYIFRKIFLGVAVMILGGLTLFTHDQRNSQAYFENEFVEDTKQTCVFEIAEVFKKTSKVNNYKAKVLQVGNKEVLGNVFLVGGLSAAFNLGDRILVNTSLETLPEPRNPYQFNYARYLENQQIYKKVNLFTNEWKLLPEKSNSLKTEIANFRKKLLVSLSEQGFSPDVLMITKAMVLGDKRELSKELKLGYSKAGVLHILAVSGLHVGIILLMLNFLFKPIEYLSTKGKVVKLFCVLLCLWGYAFLVGASPSVIRSVTMFSFVAVGLYLNTATRVLFSLVSSALILLIYNPYYLFDVGFQMSYLAVFFIIWIQPLLYEFWKPKNLFLDYFWKLLTVSTAAQLGVLPLSLFYFHQFPSLFLLTNLVVIPFVGVILSLGALVVVASYFSQIPFWLFHLYNEMVGVLNSFVLWVAKREEFLFSEIPFSIVQLLTGYIVLLFLGVWMSVKKNKYLYYLLFSIVLFQGVCFWEKYQLYVKEEFVIFYNGKQPVFSVLEKGELKVYSEENMEYSFLEDYKLGIGYRGEENHKSLQKIHELPKGYLLVVDSLSVYELNDFKNQKIILSNSPKLNLERMLLRLEPELLVFDATNYKSYVKRWQNTCEQMGVRHYTISEKGALVLR